MNGLVAGGVFAGFVIWVVFVAVNVSAGMEIAEDRGRRPIAWGVVAFLFPVVGPVLARILPPGTRGRRACPNCKESIRAAAHACPHCTREVVGARA